MKSARSTLLSGEMCALLLFLFGNAGRAEEDAVDDDEDVCRFNIGDGE